MVSNDTQKREREIFLTEEYQLINTGLTGLEKYYFYNL